MQAGMSPARTRTRGSSYRQVHIAPACGSTGHRGLARRPRLHTQFAFLRRGRRLLVLDALTSASACALGRFMFATMDRDERGREAVRAAPLRKEAAQEAVLGTVLAPRRDQSMTGAKAFGPNAGRGAASIRRGTPGRRVRGRRAPAPSPLKAFHPCSKCTRGFGAVRAYSSC